MTPAERFTSDAKHLERVAAWLYDRGAHHLGHPVMAADVSLDAFIVANTLDHLARDLREYATLYAGRIP